MIPKRIRRVIEVNGEQWEYCVTGCWTIFIKSLKTKQEISWWSEGKLKWRTPVTPSDVRKIILDKELWGVKARVSDYANGKQVMQAVAEDECPNCRNGTIGFERGRLVCRGECGHDFGQSRNARHALFAPTE